jgi:hypothetical protein
LPNVEEVLILATRLIYNAYVTKTGVRNVNYMFSFQSYRMCLYYTRLWFGISLVLILASDPVGPVKFIGSKVTKNDLTNNTIDRS